MRGKKSVFCGINFCGFAVLRRFCGIYALYAYLLSNKTNNQKIIAFCGIYICVLGENSQ